MAPEEYAIQPGSPGIQKTSYRAWVNIQGKPLLRNADDYALVKAMARIDMYLHGLHGYNSLLGNGTILSPPR